jgi:hypothetical protein
VECAPIRAQAWLDSHGSEFLDREVGEAVALIERAGLEARVVRFPGGWMTQEQQRDRVNIRLDEAGEIATVDAG